MYLRELAPEVCNLAGAAVPIAPLLFIVQQLNSIDSTQVLEENM
jgi:hypothetical protein